MPWLIGGAIDNVLEGVSIEEVIYKDHDLLKISPGNMFPGVHPYDLVVLKRREFNLGRMFVYVADDSRKLPAKMGANTVCDTFKNLIEKFDSGSNYFVQIDIRQSDQITPWPIKYWHWMCRSYVDAIVPDIGDGDTNRSKGFFWSKEKGCFLQFRPRESPEFYPILATPAPEDQRFKPVLNRDAIKTAHAWAENGFKTRDTSGYIFLSDSIVNIMRSHDILSGFGLKWVDISDLPANRECEAGYYA